MENQTKMIFLLIMLLIFGTLYQVLIGNKGSWIVGGIVLFSFGFGWYASKAMDDIEKLKGKKNGK